MVEIGARSELSEDDSYLVSFEAKDGNTYGQDQGNDQETEWLACPERGRLGWIRWWLGVAHLPYDPGRGAPTRTMQERPLTPEVALTVSTTKVAFCTTRP